MTSDRLSYEYVVLRCVPRVDREEFVNVGVVLFCHATGFLQSAWRVDAARLGAVDALVDPAQLRQALTYVDAVCDALRYVDGVCAGDERGGAAAAQPIGNRFGFLKAPRSTVLQPGPVHGGLTGDPARQLEHLRERLVG